MADNVTPEVKGDAMVAAAAPVSAENDELIHLLSFDDEREIVYGLQHFTHAGADPDDAFRGRLRERLVEEANSVRDDDQ